MFLHAVRRNENTDPGPPAAAAATPGRSLPILMVLLILKFLRDLSVQDCYSRIVVSAVFHQLMDAS